MADTFSFSNFAVSTLLYELGDNEATMSLITDDAWRFPTNLGGSKVPCVISDDSREPEIVYITTWDPSTGLASIERGREGTTPKNWLAGTFVRHTLTAESFRAVARITPRGQWQDDLQYEQGDIVLNDGISYIAVRENFNSEPTGSGTDDWQAIYIPPGVGVTVMNWAGVWSNAVSYTTGSVVSWKGQIWTALGDSFNTEPVYGIPQWALMAPWGGTHRYAPVLAATGVNNYNVSLFPDADPAALYDGMRLRILISNNNTIAATLKVGALPAVPLTVRHNVQVAKDDLWAGEIYDVTYFSGDNEWRLTMTPEQKRRLDALEKFMDETKKAIVQYKYIAGSALGGGTFADAVPPELDWPYDPTLNDQGPLDLRLDKIQAILSLPGYLPEFPADWPRTPYPPASTIQARLASLEARMSAAETQAQANYDALNTTKIRGLHFVRQANRGMPLNGNKDDGPGTLSGLSNAQRAISGSTTLDTYVDEYYWTQLYCIRGDSNWVLVGMGTN